MTRTGRRVLLGLALYALAAMTLSWGKSHSVTAASSVRQPAPTTQLIPQGWPGADARR